MNRVLLVGLVAGMTFAAQAAPPEKPPTSNEVVVTNAVIPVDAEQKRLVLRLGKSCANATVCTSEDFTVPAEYVAVVETVSMLRVGTGGIGEATITVVGAAETTFGLPLASDTRTATFTGRILAVTGEVIRLKATSSAFGGDLHLAASGYLVPASSNSLAP